VKLLFDHNLSPQLIVRLQSIFPKSDHVRTAGLADATDREVWEYARDHDFVIVSKDDDFRQLAFLHGAPPKVIWLRVGNGPTSVIEQLMAAQVATITEFGESGDESLLVLPGLAP
jgi:predicted nuclease of predicted toxin-antitoxin system